MLPNTIVGSLSVIALASVGLYSYRKSKSRLNESFLRLILFLFLWALGNTMALLSKEWGTPKGSFFWDNVTFLGIAFTPAEWFHLASLYTGRLQKKAYTVTAYLFSALFFLFYISGSLSWYPHASDPALLHPSPLYWFFVLGSYAFIVMGVILYLFQYKKSSGKEKKRVSIMVVSTLFPILGNVFFNIYLLFGAPPSVDPTIFLFAISGVLFAYGISYLELLEVTMFDPSFIAILFENLNDAVFFLGKEGRFSIVNPEAEELTGYTLEELRKANFQRIVHPEDLKMVEEGFNAIKEGRQALNRYEFRIKRKEGGMLNVEGAFRLLKKEGEAVGTLLVMRNITERKKAEEAMEQSKTQLEFINDLMSHDLSNIDQIALGSIEMLSETGLTERQKKFLISAKSAVLREGRLLANVKLLKRMREEKEEMEELELPSIIRRAIEKIEEYPGKRVKVEYTPRGGQMIWANSYLSMAFENLFDNAIRFTPQTTMRIAVNVFEKDGSFEIEIKDWGKGIPDDMKKDIFHRYEGLSAGKLGTGLGLYATKMIVEGHSGKIWVENNPEGGSVFCVELPKHE